MTHKDAFHRFMPYVVVPVPGAGKKKWLMLNRNYMLLGREDLDWRNEEAKRLAVTFTRRPANMEGVWGLVSTGPTGDPWYFMDGPDYYTRLERLMKYVRGDLGMGGRR